VERGQDRRVDGDDVFLIGQLGREVEGPLSSERWRIFESQVIDWREWGDEFVVRVASRSETHLLGAAAGSILLVLLEGRQALTLDAIYAMATGNSDTLGAMQNPRVPAADRERLQAIVTDFERLGIVTRSAA
jgi:hypothetical protein